MQENTDILSTLERRREAQRRHAARLKAAGAPRADDLGRALVAAVRDCIADGVPTAERAVWERLITSAVDQLVAKGFNRSEVRKRLLRALLPRDS
jgi:hypothetical protein